MIMPSDILHAKILIVDDKEANVLLLERMLQNAGYVSVTSTMDSSKVCELHLQNNYALILLDLQMPGMDGFQVMENLKEIETGGYLPVLVITAQPNHKLRALKAGAKDFISKPLDLAEVLIRVHNMLEVRLLHQETQQLYARVLAEQQVSERLIRQFSPSVLDYLNAPTPVESAYPIEKIVESYAEVALLFADIVAFTKFAEGVSAQVLVGVLNDISNRFDGEITHTMEDAWLATMTLSDPEVKQAIAASQMALEMIRALDRFNMHSRYKIHLRLGLDTRTDVGSTIQNRKYLYNF